jgi:hypothetical protein
MSSTPLHDAMKAAIARCYATLDEEIDRVAEVDLLTAARMCQAIYEDLDPLTQCTLIRVRATHRLRRPKRGAP